MRKHIVLFALAVGATALAAEPSLAASFDFSKAEDAGNEILAWLQGNLATILLTIALIVTGFLAAFNRIPWAWFWAVFFGAFIIFSASKIVSWLQTGFAG